MSISSVLRLMVPRPCTFTTPVSGDEEVPANDSKARGVAHFQLDEDGTELSYRLVVANIEDVTMADCVALAREVAAEVAARFDVPVFL